MALNIYERASLQISRLASYVLLSPHFQSVQSLHSIKIFMRFLAKKFFSLAERWSKEKSFSCSIRLVEIEWIVKYASFKIWNRRCLLHRKKERNMIRQELNDHRKLLSKEKINSWKELFDADDNLRVFSIHL